MVVCVKKSPAIPELVENIGT